MSARSWISEHRWIAAVAASAVALAAAGVIAIAAGGDEAGAGAEAEAAQAFRDCMAEHGAELPAAPGGDAPQFEEGMPPPGSQPPEGQAAPGAADQEALSACQDLMPAPPDGGELPPGAPQSMPLPNN